MYHDVSSERPEGLFVVSEKSFSHQMTHLVKQGYHVVSLDELVSAHETRQALRPKTVVLTFDDGLESHFNVVYPILKRLGLTATFFIVPEFVGEPGYLTWSEVKELSGHGFTIGSHSLRHRDLSALSSEECEKDIVSSKKLIEGALNKKITLFCYPGGRVNPMVREKVIKAGFRGACAIRPWHRFPSGDLYALTRVWMTRRANHPFVLWLKLNGWDRPWEGSCRPTRSSMGPGI